MNKNFYGVIASLWALISLLTVFILIHFKQEIEHDEKASTRNLVEHAYSIVSSLETAASEQKLSEKQAKDLATTLLSNMKNHTGQYIFASTQKPTLHYTAHGRTPEVIYKPMINLGKEYIAVGQSIYKQLEQLGGQGFVDYEWYSPGEQKLHKKISYVMKSHRWEWLIGSGTYTRDPSYFFYNRAVWIIAIMVCSAALLTWLLWLIRHHFLLHLGEDPRQIAFRIKELGRGIFNQIFPHDVHPPPQILDAIEYAQNSIASSIASLKYHSQAMEHCYMKAQTYFDFNQNIVNKLITQSNILSLEYKDSSEWFIKMCEHIKRIKFITYEAGDGYFIPIEEQLEQFHMHSIQRQKQMHLLLQNIQELRESMEQSHMLTLHTQMEMHQQQTDTTKPILIILRELQEKHNEYVQNLYDHINQLNAADLPLIQQTHHIRQLIREGYEYTQKLEHKTEIYSKNHQEIQKTLADIEERFYLHQQKQSTIQNQSEYILSSLYQIKEKNQTIYQNFLEYQQHMKHIKGSLTNFTGIEQA
jgi:hypothetical protein